MTPIVVKLGGSLLENREMRDQALEAIADCWDSGRPLVIVHGGGKHIDAALQQAGIPKRTAGGLRVTDDKTLPIVVSVLAGTVNKSLVSELASKEVDALGLSGADGGMLGAVFHPPVDGVDLGFVGQIVFTKPAILEPILGAGALPVIASLAMGPAGTLLNVNADSAASAIAAGVGAERLVFLTDVEGVLDHQHNVLPLLATDEVRAFLGTPFVTGGMRPKLQAALQALQSGVTEVIIAGPATHASALAGGTGGTQLVAA